MVALLVLPSAVAAQTVSAQKVVPVTQEPHHHIVFEDARLRVLDVDIPGGATTLDHRHDDDLLFISVGPADTRTREPGTDWGPQRPRRPLGEVGTVDYSGKPGAHTIQNVGTLPYLLIAVENKKLREWVKPAPVAAPGVASVHESRAFRASSMRVDSSSPITRSHRAPTVVVLITGDAELKRGGASPQALSVAKRWALVPDGESFTVSARPGSTASLVEVEVH